MCLPSVRLVTPVQMAVHKAVCPEVQHVVPMAQRGGRASNVCQNAALQQQTHAVLIQQLTQLTVGADYCCRKQRVQQEAEAGPTWVEAPARAPASFLPYGI